MIQYEVEKFCRGLQGEWHGMGAKRFNDPQQARQHFEGFAAGQAKVLCNGIRIDLRERKGRRVIATVGGVLDNPTVIRELA